MVPEFRVMGLLIAPFNRGKYSASHWSCSDLLSFRHDRRVISCLEEMYGINTRLRRHLLLRGVPYCGNKIANDKWFPARVYLGSGHDSTANLGHVPRTSSPLWKMKAKCYTNLRRAFQQVVFCIQSKTDEHALSYCLVGSKAMFACAKNPCSRNFTGT